MLFNHKNNKQSHSQCVVIQFLNIFNYGFLSDKFDHSAYYQTSTGKHDIFNQLTCRLSSLLYLKFPFDL